MTRKQSPALAEITVTPEVLATYLDMTANSVTRLAATAGLPKASRGRYPLFECVRWYLNRLKTHAAEHPSDLRDERRKLLIAQHQGQTLANAATRAAMLDAELVAATMQEMLSRITGHLDDLPKLAGQISAMRDPGEIARVLFDACRQVRSKAAADMVAFAKSLDDGNA